MSNDLLECDASQVEVLEGNWHDGADRTYICHVVLLPEVGGGYSAHAVRLPGVVSEGNTIDEALSNIEDAFQTALNAYLESGDHIPWTQEAAETYRSSGAIERRIMVHV